MWKKKKKKKKNLSAFALYQNACAFTQHKPLAVLIPRSRRGLRIVIPLRQSSASNESTETGGDDAGFGASGYHYIGLAPSNVVCSRVETIVGCGASGRDRVIRTHHAEVNRQQSRAHVRDGVRDEEGRHSLVPFL